MIINEDHFVNEVFHDAGEYTLTKDYYGSRYVLVGVRILVDPNDSGDVAAVAAIQDRLAIDARTSQTFVMPDYQLESLDATRDALLALARGLNDFDRMFGARKDIDPVRHLIGCAAGWGGLPASEATYVGADPDLPPADYELVFSDVPVDAFWSVSIYNERGFFEPNEKNLYSVNDVTGEPNVDGSITVRLVASAAGDTPANAIVTPRGWNYLIRLYRPRAEILNGEWSPPAPTPVDAS